MIDPKWVDVAFDFDGQFSGWSGMGEPDCASYEDDRSLIIPRSEWRDHPIPDRESMLDHHHLNQGPEPTCTGNAASNGGMAKWREQYGLANAISISPISLYNHCGNSRSGSTTSCIMRQMRDTGCLLIDNSKNRAILRRMGLPENHVLPARGTNLRPNSWPRGWQDTAKHFRVEEVYQVRTVEGFFSALLRGFSLLYGRQGHAICGMKFVVDNGKIYCKYKNSWRKDWHDRGYGYDSESMIRRAVPWVYAYRTMVATDATKKLILPPTVAA